MARRRRRRSSRTAPLVATVILLGGGTYFRDTWLGWFTGDSTSSRPAAAMNEPQPVLTTERPEDGSSDAGPYADVPERGSDALTPGSSVLREPDPAQAAALLQSAAQTLAEGDLVQARAHLSEAMNLGLSPHDELETRTQLRKLGRETIFSANRLKDDPFTDYYVIKPGDSLQKIARAHAVTAELLARINGIADINRIRAGRRIKVVHGPFNARLHKSTHTLDVYLGQTFVDYFKVGLGAEDATPSGTWMVKNRLSNPTYYPPRGGKIVAADDPQNPLGERWMGLEGIAGHAAGQMRYGIHGTIEPESIGKNTSLGCIRLYNEDVELLFDLLVVKESTVDIRD